MIDEETVENIKDLSNKKFCVSLEVIGDIMAKRPDIDNIIITYKANVYSLQARIKIKLKADRANKEIAIEGVDNKSAKVLCDNFDQIKENLGG